MATSTGISAKLGDGEYGRAEMSLYLTEDDLLRMLRELHSAKAVASTRDAASGGA